MLKHLQGRLQGNPSMSVEYDTIFQRQLQQGIIEKIPKVEEKDLIDAIFCHIMGFYIKIRRQLSYV